VSALPVRTGLRPTCSRSAADLQLWV